MNQYEKTIKDIEPLVPFSRGSTEIFLTGHWSPRKPLYSEKTSPCRQACPIGNDIARAFHYAGKGDYDEALRIYRRDNPLPGVCGRVCYHPCEADCNRKPFDEAINIRGFERFLADHGRVDMAREVPAKKRRERVAIIGSGPAGLSASYHLARLGYAVTIFEALPQAGGMLRYGIPEYRLPREILEREIGYIRQLGVDIKTGVRAGKDLDLKELNKTYQAIFMAIGSHAGQRLGLDGEDMAGVLDGISFLRRFNLGESISLGERVAIVGGGNTAVDCARTARRLGSKDVKILYRRSRAEMPALPEDVRSVEREDVSIAFLAAPEKLIFEKGRLTAISCTRMELGAPDESGRPQPVAIPGSQFIIPAETLIAAVGQTPESDFAREFGVSVDRRGIIQVSSQTAATSREGIFAGGDSSGAKAFVADAIAGGKMGALAIYCYFDGKDMTEEYSNSRIGGRASFSFEKIIHSGSYSPNLKNVVPFEKINTLCFTHDSRNENPEKAPGEPLMDFSEEPAGLDPTTMGKEISRCFKCGVCTRCDLCFLLCPDISIVKAEPTAYTVRTDYCKGCGICATTCPRHVIDMSESGGGR